MTSCGHHVGSGSTSSLIEYRLVGLFGTTMVVGRTVVATHRRRWGPETRGEDPVNGVHSNNALLHQSPRRPAVESAVGGLVFRSGRSFKAAV